MEVCFASGFVSGFASGLASGLALAWLLLFGFFCLVLCVIFALIGFSFLGAHMIVASTLNGFKRKIRRPNLYHHHIEIMMYYFYISYN